jgi:hypothetical protein
MRAGDADSTDSAKAMHVYAAIGGLKIDVRGPVNEAEYLKSNDYTAREVSAGDLAKVDPNQESTNGPLDRWRHYLEPEFVLRASERARHHIEQHLQQWRSILSSHHRFIDQLPPQR